MQELLAEFPDATQIDDHSIGWDNGKVVLVLPENDADQLSAEDHGSEPSPVAGLNRGKRADLGEDRTTPRRWVTGRVPHPTCPT
jgi:hypothetical protein